MTLIHKTPGAFTVATQTGAADTEVNDAATGVLRSYQQKLIDGMVVQPNDRKLMLDATTVTSAPDTTDEVDIGGTRFQIVKVRTFAPAGVVIAYDCQVRGL